MKKSWKLLLALTIALPVSAVAAGPFTSTFTNDSRTFTLKQNFLWGKECITTRGQHDLAPGQTTTLVIADGCKWAGIRYDVYNGDTVIGSVAHNFREGMFTTEISNECKGMSCKFTGMPPV